MVWPNCQVEKALFRADRVGSAVSQKVWPGLRHDKAEPQEAQRNTGERTQGKPDANRVLGRKKYGTRVRNTLADVCVRRPYIFSRRSLDVPPAAGT